MSTPGRHPAPAFDVFNVHFERVYDPAMHLLFAFDGRVDERVLETATLRLLAANPYLRSRYVEAEAAAEGEPWARWEELPPSAWAGAFVVREAGEDEELPPAAPPASLDVFAGPQLRVTVYRRGDGGDLVAVTCHHGFADARGLKDLARQLFAVAREIGRDPDYRPLHAGRYDRGTDRILARFSAAEREAAIAAEEPFVDRWCFPYVRKGRGTPRNAWRTFSPERLARIRAFGRAHGATVNDILIGAFFLALLAVRDDPADRDTPRSVLVSADARRHLDRQEEYSIMNLSIASAITLVAGSGARLGEIIGDITAITKRWKADGLGLGCILFYEEIFAGGPRAVRAFFDGMVAAYEETARKNPVFSNVGIIDPDEYLPVPGRDGTTPGLRHAWYLPTVCRPFGFLMILSTFRDAITIMTGYEAGPYDPATVERFLDCVDRYLP